MWTCAIGAGCNIWKGTSRWPWPHYLFQTIKVTIILMRIFPKNLLYQLYCSSTFQFQEHDHNKQCLHAGHMSYHQTQTVSRDDRSEILSLRFLKILRFCYKFCKEPNYCWFQYSPQQGFWQARTETTTLVPGCKRFTTRQVDTCKCFKPMSQNETMYHLSQIRCLLCHLSEWTPSSLIFS